MLTFDVPQDPAFWQFPYPVYRSALSQGDGLYAFSAGGYSVLGYNALASFGRNQRIEGHPFPADGFGEGQEHLTRLLRWGLFALEGSVHRALRRAVIAGLSGARIGALDLVHPINAQIQEAAARPLPDLFKDFSRPLCARIFCQLVGIEDDQYHLVDRAVAAIGEQMNVPDQAEPGLANVLAGEVLGRLERLQASGRSGFLTDITAALPVEAAATPAELAAALLFDTVEMMAIGLFGVVDLLARHGELQGDLLAGRYDLARAVQEAFRLTSPAILTSRMAMADIAWGDHVIARGSPMLFWWASGNLDASVYPDPLRFDPSRPGPRHLAFGIGPHACLGQTLTARLTVTVCKMLLLRDGARIELPQETRFLPRLARIPETAPVIFK